VIHEDNTEAEMEAKDLYEEAEIQLLPFLFVTGDL